MRALPFLVALGGIALFAGMDAVMKGQSIAHGAWGALLWRSVFGAAASSLIFAGARKPVPPRERVRLHLARSGAAAASILLFFWGLARTPMAEAVALTFLVPLVAAFLAALLIGERLRPQALGGSLLALGGVALMLAAKGRGGGEGSLAGAGAILVASLLYAYNLVLLRRSAQSADPIEITLATNLVMLAVFVAGAPWFGAWPRPGDWWLLALAAGLQVTSSMLLAWAYAHAEAQLLAITEYSAFLWAALLGWIVYREPLTGVTLAGAALIVAGCVAATRTRAPAAQTEAAL